MAWALAAAEVESESDREASPQPAYLSVVMAELAGLAQAVAFLGLRRSASRVDRWAFVLVEEQDAVQPSVSVFLLQLDLVLRPAEV